MGHIGLFITIWLGAILLKILGVPGFKNIGWGWFIVAPILYPIARLLWYVISFLFYLGIAVGTVWGIAELIMWAT